MPDHRMNSEKLEMAKRLKIENEKFSGIHPTDEIIG